MPKNEPSGDEDEVVVVVTVHLDHHFGSTLLTNFYRFTKFMKLNSNIIINNNIAISNELIYHTKHNSKSPVPQLLYRGTRDGFKAEDFHSKCDNQGPTLTIIKSSEPYNQIFGGFTTQSWKSSESGEWISDDSAFLFKIEDENSNQLFRKFNVKQDEKQRAIYNNKHYLTIFGFGHDLCLVSDCNLNEWSYTDFGYTYELPSLNTNDDDNDYEHPYGSSEKVNSYLAGSYNFKVLEIEVFKIIITTTTATTTTTQ